jgi:DNA-binding LacI/PurR family transcriptional regulator
VTGGGQVPGMTVSKKRVSIKDIAELAGVSHPTVSRALRGEGRVSEDTRARILEIADEVGYTPSMIARGLVTQRSNSVGLVVTNFADPFHSEIAQGVEEEALRHQYSIFLASTTVDPSREIEVVRNFQARQVDGIIVSSSRVGGQYAGLLQETGIPIVLINTHAEGDNMHMVYHDDYGGTTNLVEHLLDAGHECIAFLGNQRGAKVMHDRYRAWHDTLTRAGRRTDMVCYGPNGRLEGGAQGAHDLVTLMADRWGKAPDALVCYNDTMAIGAISVLREQGLRIPDDIAVTGFDDVDVAAYFEPPLTTWRQPRRAMGRAAMEMMLDLLNSESNGESRVHVMQGELVVRRSA